MVDVHVQKKKELEALEGLKLIFQALSNGRDGISKTDFADVLDTLGQARSPEYINKLFDEVDEDKSGMIDLDEFVNLMNSDDVGLGNATEQLKQAFVVIPKIRTLKSVPKRVWLFLMNLVKTLLLTADEMDDIGFEIAPEIFDKSTIFTFGVFKRMVFVVVIAFLFQLFYREYTSGTQFVALDKSAGRNCTVQQKPWTIPAIGADYYGNWQGQLEYQPNKQMYTFAIFNFMGDLKIEYLQWIKKVQANVADIGKVMRSQDLAVNLLFWSSWTVTVPAGSNPQTLSLNGDAKFIMSSDYKQGSLGNVHVDCDFMLSTINYDTPTQQLQMAYSHSQLMSDPQCKSIVNPKLMGYNPTLSGDTFSIAIDVYTLFSALGVAYQINGPETFNNFVVIDTWLDTKFRGVDYVVQRMYDPLYPSMTPMFCLGPKFGNVTEYNCLIQLGDTYGIPFFQPAGASTTDPVRCDCATAAGYSDACNQLNLMAGVIVYDTSRNATDNKNYDPEILPFLPALEFFYVPPVNTGIQANSRAFEAAWALLLGQRNPRYNYKNPAWRRRAYDFTTTPSFGYGSLVAFQVQTIGDWSISQNKYQLKDGSCSASALTPHFSSFYDNPWGTLDEPYYQCFQKPTSALIDAGGISVGIAALIVPPAMIIIMYCALSCAAYWRTDDYVKKLQETCRVGQTNRSHGTTRYADTYIEMAVKTTSSPTTSESAAAAAASSGSSYVEFMKARRREFMADHRYDNLTQAEITDLILGDWRALRARQRSA